MAEPAGSRRKGNVRASAGRESRLPKERVQFKQLIARNPNYFGNLVESELKLVKKIIGNTTYEELTCIGYNPDLSLLEGTVEVKLPFGFSGDLCQPGSIEYVRFYVDYGSGWQDAGIASFDSHDIPNIVDCRKDPDKPLTYVVTLPFQPDTNYCRHPVLPKIRGILSWQAMPPAGNAAWPPVWGNVLDKHIQIKPRPWLFGDLIELLGPTLEKIELPVGVEEALPHPIPIPDPPPLPLSELAEMYSGGKAGRPQAGAAKSTVEPHRFGIEHVQSALVSGSLDQTSITASISEWASLGLDWGAAVAALADTEANVSYEELECLGLDYDRERLVATLRIKRPTGYSGDLCHKGSLEYVAFWADWEDTCDWMYLGTATLSVHDIASIPADGLSYSVVLPVELNAIRRPCKEPKVARVRAVLSWSVPPSTVNPEGLNYWGNRIDAHVQIRPGDPILGPGPIIWTIGGIRLDDINVFGNGMTKPSVTFALYGYAFADEWAPHTRECPFGGTLVITGPSFPGFKYRFWAQDVASGGVPVLIKDQFWTVPPVGPGTWRTPDPMTGFSFYLNPPTQNIENVLGYWTPGGDHQWEIRMEIADIFDNVLGSTPAFTIQLDNTGPRRKPIGEAPLPDDTMDIHIDGGGDCKDFTKGVTITGRFVARDVNFGRYTLQTLPSSLGPPSPVPSSGIVQTAPALPAPGGNGWSLSTSTMDPCGYVILLQVWDRSIVNSYPGSHNYNFTDVGFCLRPPSDE